MLTEVAGFTVVREIGRGGMGVVYLAEQSSLGRQVALKVIAPSLAGDPQFRERFEHEAHHAASIEHPNVIPVFQAGVEGEHVYLAMRYVEGEDLGTVIEREGPLDPDAAVSVVEQIGAALDAAHGKGLVHRDVKPANILLDGGAPDGHAYLTDFGLTKEQAAVSGLTNTGAWVGTVDYASPEQIDGRPVDARSDVYSLACVLYEALTAKPPFEGTAAQKMWAHMSEAPPSLAFIRPEIAPALDPVIERGLAKEADERYPSAGDLGRAASAAAAGNEIKVPERSVATGLAAAVPGRAAETRAARTAVAAGGSTPSERRTVPLPAGPPTERRDRAATPPSQPGGGASRRVLAVAALILAVAAGVGAAALLVSQLDQGDEPDVTQTAASPDDAGESSESAGGADGEQVAAGNTGNDRPDTEPAGAPASFAPYEATEPGFAYTAELPEGDGWSAPTEALEGGGERLRTEVTGSDGSFVFIDYTPGVVPDPGASADSQSQVPHPTFGTATEYVISSSEVVPGCTTADPCIDYVVDDGQGGGWAVLAGGPDMKVATDIASTVADSISS